MASSTVQLLNAPRFSVTAQRVDQRGADQPGHERGIFHRVPEPPAAPAELVVGPPGAQRDADAEEGPGDDGPGRDQRAQAASSLPPSKAAMAKAKATEKPT